MMMMMGGIGLSCRKRLEIVSELVLAVVVLLRGSVVKMKLYMKFFRNLSLFYKFQ